MAKTDLNLIKHDKNRLNDFTIVSLWGTELLVSHFSFVVKCMLGKNGQQIISWYTKYISLSKFLPEGC